MELDAIEAAVTVKTSHDCSRDVWGWEASISGPRYCYSESSMPEPDGESMSTDDSHSIKVEVWGATPSEALERAAATYRAAYAASVSQVEHG